MATAQRTREEAERLYMENQKLVGFFYRKYAGMLAPFTDLTPEDIMQHVRTSLWIAALQFDQAKSAFSTYAGHAIYTDLCHLRRKRVTKGRYESTRLASLDIPVSAEVDVLLVDLMPSSDDVEAGCVTALDFEAHRRKLSPKAQRAVDMKLRGMTQPQIAHAMGCSQPQISRYLKKAAAFAE